MDAIWTTNSNSFTYNIFHSCLPAASATTNLLICLFSTLLVPPPSFVFSTQNLGIIDEFSLFLSTPRCLVPLNPFRTGAISFISIFLSASCSISCIQKNLNRYLLSKYNLRCIVIKNKKRLSCFLLFIHWVELSPPTGHHSKDAFVLLTEVEVANSTKTILQKINF